MNIYVLSHDLGIDWQWVGTLVDRSGHRLEPNPANADVILALGGDGTTLDALKLANKTMFRPIVIGCNFGSVGFLTYGNDFIECLDGILKSGCHERRRYLKCKIPFQNNFSAVAFNEVVVSNIDRDKFVNILITIPNTMEQIQYQADSVIFATPTGSTAYNLSAGGSLVHPSIAGILVTPVAPFSMSARPIILPDHYVLTITSSNEVAVTIDGKRVTSLVDNQGLVITHSQNNEYVELIKPKDNFITSISSKLGWGAIIKK